MVDTTTPAPTGQTPVLSGRVVALVRMAMARMGTAPVPLPGELVGDPRLPLAIRAIVDAVISDEVDPGSLMSLGSQLDQGLTLVRGSPEIAAAAWLGDHAASLAAADPTLAAADSAPAADPTPSEGT